MANTNTTMAVLSHPEWFCDLTRVTPEDEMNLEFDEIAQMILSNGTAQVFIPDIEAISTEEWEKSRVKIGGSDAAVCMGVGYKTRKQLFWDKTGQTDVLDEDKDKWFTFDYGHINEPLVIKALEVKTGLKVQLQRSMWRGINEPFMQADCDGFTIINGELWIVEIKTTNENSLRTDWGSADDTRCPEKYVWQCRHYMHVTGAKGAILCAMAGNSLDSLRVRVIEFDDAFDKQLVDAERDFWETYVEQFEEPEDYEKDSKVLDAAKSHYGVIKEEIPLDEAYKGLVRDYLEKKAKKSALEKEARALEKELATDLAPIAEFLEGHEGRLDLGEDEVYRVFWKETTRQKMPAPKLKKFIAEHPDLVTDYVEVNTTNSLNIEKEKSKAK